MTQFTQLNLQGKSDGKSAPNTAATPQRPDTPVKQGTHKNSHKGRMLTLIGSAVAVSLIGVSLLETSGCSKANKNAISAPASQPSTQAAIPAPASAAMPAPAVKKPVKKARRAKIPTATYSNADYGVSFRYPKYDTLKQGDEAKLEWTGLGPVPMNFSEPGGTTLSAVELPNGLYPGTDFAGAFFNVNVAPKLTAEQCEQFSSSKEESSNSAGKPVSPAKVKIGKTEFSTMETLSGDAKQADAKYYHLFQNGNCYEFTLGMQTANDQADDAATPVSRGQVFARLRWILSTVKIKSSEATPVVAAGTTPVTGASDNTAVKIIDDRQ
jgi:hypothetical protein